MCKIGTNLVRLKIMHHVMPFIQIMPMQNYIIKETETIWILPATPFTSTEYKCLLNAVWMGYKWLMNSIWMAYEFAMHIAYETLMNCLWTAY